MGGGDDKLKILNLMRPAMAILPEVPKPERQVSKSPFFQKLAPNIFIFY